MPSLTNDSAWSALSRTISEVYPDAVIAPYLMMGATDSRYFRTLTPNVYRFTGNRIDVEDRERIHGTNERISVKNYLAGIGFCERLMTNLAGS